MCEHSRCTQPFLLKSLTEAVDQMGLRMDNLHAPTVSSGPTSRPTANGTEKQQSLQDLSAQKENVEAELSALSSVLDSVSSMQCSSMSLSWLMVRLQHGVNMNTSLTTFDGFPRADIDVAQIRTTRARIVRLKTDHKLLMEKLEKAVHEAFAAGKASEIAASSLQASAESRQGNGAPAVQASPVAIEPPFAKVNTVVPNSPADEAGMQAGDRVTRFGAVNWTNHERLSRVAQEVQEGRTITVKVLRQASESAASQSLELRLTPRRNWGGRGLLGCHLLPL